MREEISFGITMVIIFLIGFGLGTFMEKPKVVFEEQIEENPVPELYDSGKSEVHTKLVAVDNEGEGVLTDLYVRAVPGNGRLFVDVDNLLFWMDTQKSIQKAKKVAEKYLGKKANNVDLTYIIKADTASVVGGPSAGAAFAVATIAALENKTLKNYVAVTGTIEEDGTIGEVGGILAKGKAVKEGGFKKFLVPKGEKVYTEYKREKECETLGSLKVCDINYRPVEINVEKEIGIDVIEVENIKDVLEYMM